MGFGWNWSNMCTSMIAPTVCKNFQSPFEPREPEYVRETSCVLLIRAHPRLPFHAR